MSIENTLAERGNRYGDFTDHARLCQGIQFRMQKFCLKADNADGFIEPWKDRLNNVQRQALTVIADKIARILSGDPNYADNWHDIQGYAKLVEDRLPKTEQQEHTDTLAQFDERRDALRGGSGGGSHTVVLPDGSAFGVVSFPLSKDHWLYADRAYEDGADQPKELPAPILNHGSRETVVAAGRYAVRGATNCGKGPDFDPDALVQNIVYALCGPYGGAFVQPPEAPIDPAEHIQRVSGMAITFGKRVAIMDAYIKAGDTGETYTDYEARMLGKDQAPIDPADVDISDNSHPRWKDAPDWANYLAQDGDGSWYWYEHPIYAREDNDAWYEQEGFDGRIDDIGEAAECNPDWRNTRQARPTK